MLIKNIKSYAVKMFILTLLMFSHTIVISKKNGSNISAEIFGQLPNYSEIEISPDGARIATFRRETGKKVLYTLSLRPDKKIRNPNVTYVSKIVIDVV